MTEAQFRQAEAAAPKGYPTLFVVSQASTQPGSLLGDRQGCEMFLQTYGKVYFITATDGFTSGCKVFSPGTQLWGHVHTLLGPVVDILDESGAKPKSRRFLVKNVELVDPSKQ